MSTINTDPPPVAQEPVVQDAIVPVPVIAISNTTTDINNVPASAAVSAKRVLSDKQRAALDRGRIARHTPKTLVIPTPPDDTIMPVVDNVASTSTRKRSVYIRVKGDSSSSESDEEDDPRRKIITIRTRKKKSADTASPIDSLELKRLRDQNAALLTLTALYATPTAPAAIAPIAPINTPQAAPYEEEEEEERYYRRLPTGRLFIPHGYN